MHHQYYTLLPKWNNSMLIKMQKISSGIKQIISCIKGTAEDQQGKQIKEMTDKNKERLKTDTSKKKLSRQSWVDSNILARENH